jgi:DNA-binding IclR family transcriptional regulator
LYELPKSTLSKILHTLESEELVRKDSESNKYQLGNKLIELGSAARSSLEIRNISRPIMIQLHEKLNLTVHLGVVAHGEVLPIESIESSNWNWHHFKYPVAVGISAPMYATGAGKAILAFLEPSEIDHILSQQLIKFTDSTKTEIHVLQDELIQIRKRGYAVSNAEHDEMIRSVAAPVFNSDGKAIASLSVLGLASRITPEKILNISGDVLSATREISHIFGYQD